MALKLVLQGAIGQVRIHQAVQSSFHREPQQLQNVDVTTPKANLHFCMKEPLGGIWACAFQLQNENMQENVISNY